MEFPDAGKRPIGPTQQNISVIALSLVVGVNGRAQDNKVTSTLGLDLDQQASEALRKIQVQAAIMRDGRAVPVYSTIDVHFHLPEKCFPASKSAANSK